MINVKHIFTLLAVIHFKVIEEANEYDIMNRAEPYLINPTLISKENFMKLELWFENDPIYSDIACKIYYKIFFISS